MLDPKTFDQWINRLSALPMQGGGDKRDMNTLKPIYYFALSDLSDEAYVRAALAVLQTSRWFPTPADIRERAMTPPLLAPAPTETDPKTLAEHHAECAAVAASVSGLPLREAFARIDAHYKL